LRLQLSFVLRRASGCRRLTPVTENIPTKTGVSMRIRWTGMAFAFALALISAAPADAQIADLVRSRYSPAAYYNYGEPGDVTILVSVWGTVRNPGLYEIPAETTLGVLFSLAGGPAVTSRRKQDRRTVTARLLRGSAQDVAFEIEMQNEILALSPDPVLVAGDVLTVDTVERAGLSWRDVFPVVAAVASVTLAVERLASK